MNGRFVAVVRKEFREYRRNKFIVFTMAVMPALLLLIVASETFALSGGAPARIVHAAVGQALLFFLLVPVILPITVAAYAVIGEREQGTLEPVLTTPATDGELLAGKAVAAVIPAVLLAWVLFGLYVAAAVVLGRRDVVEAVWTVEQLVGQLTMAPALAGFAIVVGMLVSLRSTDIRVAQQLAGVASLPVMGLVAVASFRVVEPSVALYLAGAALVGAVDVAGWWLLGRLFSRERLLTRYGA